ncbi:hypothetical protein D3C81_1476980 [compost metagenome]
MSCIGGRESCNCNTCTVNKISKRLIAFNIFSINQMKFSTCEERHEHLPYRSVKGCTRKLHDSVIFFNAQFGPKEGMQIGHALMSYHDSLRRASGA